jgi:small subunit ribosomal protein S6
LRYYENLFIVDPNFDQDRLSDLISVAKEEITQNGGNIISVDSWGKKKLAYPIEKHKYGNYILIQFETENHKLVKALENWMELKNEILAKITVRLDKKPEEEPVKD